jgi:SAM-dependent methyltransferase
VANEDENRTNYEAFYRNFDLPVMRQFRIEAYGEDLGQHSWVSAEELRSDIQRLRLSSSSLLMDLGCGPGGILAFVAEHCHCRCVGLEISQAALHAARVMACRRGVENLVDLRAGDLNELLPFADNSFCAVVAFDVILHARNRREVFREIGRVLKPGGTFLFTDAAVLTGAISNEAVALRSSQGFTQIVSPGFNERLLTEVGLRVSVTEDRTGSVVTAAKGRLVARQRHRAEFARIENANQFDTYQRYLEETVNLASDASLSRIMYLCERM